MSSYTIAPQTPTRSTPAQAFKPGDQVLALKEIFVQGGSDNRTMTLQPSPTTIFTIRSTRGLDASPLGNESHANNTLYSLQITLSIPTWVSKGSNKHTKHAELSADPRKKGSGEASLTSLPKGTIVWFRVPIICTVAENNIEIKRTFPKGTQGVVEGEPFSNRAMGARGGGYAPATQNTPLHNVVYRVDVKVLQDIPTHFFSRYYDHSFVEKYEKRT